MTSITLYPPRISNYIPSGLCNEDQKIYFSISQFNKIQDIKYIQLRISNQYTNLTVLNTNLYPNETKIYSEFQQDEKGYFITLQVSDLENKQLQINQYYKVQIRLFSTESSDLPSDGGIGAWLETNKEKASEWSIVGLLRGISKPSIILELDGQDKIQDEIYYITNSILRINGLLAFQNEEQMDILESYSIRFYQATYRGYGIIIQDTGVITADYNALNKITHAIKQQLIDQTNYVLVIQYTTVSGYTNKIFYKIKTDFAKNLLIPKANISAEVSHNCINLIISNIGYNYSARKPKRYFIKRADSKNNFKTWETVGIITIKKRIKELLFKDETVQSNVFYKYAIQEKMQVQNNKFTYSKLKVLQNEFKTVSLDGFFLCDGQDTLKILYDQKIENYQYNVQESITPTLGGKFPFIKRNGQNYYRTFSIGGLIAFEMDNNILEVEKDSTGTKLSSQLLIQSEKQKSHSFDYNQILSKENANLEIFKPNALHDLYSDQNNISRMDKEFFYQRLFRQKVIQILYRNNVKLFRSATEGNMLIKLSNITLTPKIQLGRKLYSFSAEATEIDECTIQNLYKYKIIREIIIENDYTATLNDLLGFGRLGRMHLSRDRGVEIR